jgi:hypothetical protein
MEQAYGYARSRCAIAEQSRVARAFGNDRYSGRPADLITGVLSAAKTPLF